MFNGKEQVSRPRRRKVPDLREMRVALGFTQMEMAKYSGIPVGTIRDWEQGKHSPPDYVLKMLKRLIKAEKSAALT